MSAVSPRGPIRVLQVGTISATTGDETGVLTGAAHPPVDCSDLTNIVFYIKSSDVCSAGTVVLEERDLIGDTPGTIATITLATPFASAGGTYAYHIQNAAYGLVNARIGTDSVGGNIIVVLRAS